MSNSRFAFLFLRLVIIAAFTILSVQLWQLQIVRGETYRQEADLNRLRIVSVRAPRGVIYDRQKRLLARNIPSFAVAIVPADLPRPGNDPPGNGQPTLERVYARLSALLNIPVATIEQKVNNGRADPFTPVVIQGGVDRDTAFILEEEHLRLPGVIIEREPIRQYLEGPLLAHIVGYVSRITPEEFQRNREVYAQTDKVGRTGVELTFEEELRGIKGKKEIEVDASGREVRLLAEAPPTPGHNLVLTLDLDLQRQVAAFLAEGVGKTGAKSGAAIAMDPQTGEILALVSLPTYDNNLFAGEISQQEWQRLLDDPLLPLLNRGIGGNYPPGSTLKIVTAAAGLQEQVISRKTILEDHGALIIPDKYNPETKWRFPCWLETGHGRLDVVEALAQSCDVFFYQVAGGAEDFVGLDGGDVVRLGRYARAFGLGEKTGIDLSGEAPGLVPDNAWKLRQSWNVLGIPWVTGDTYNMAIGQGYVLATPLQVLNMGVVIANGGTLYRPQIVREVVDADGKVVQPFRKQVIRQVPLSPETLSIVREGMAAAVTHGTATMLRPPVPAAGKTGTAEYGEVIDAKGTMRTHAWFVGFAPLTNPQIALVVFIEGSGVGASDAVPIASKILHYYFSTATTPPGS